MKYIYGAAISVHYAILPFCVCLDKHFIGQRPLLGSLSSSLTAPYMIYLITVQSLKISVIFVAVSFVLVCTNPIVSLNLH